MRRFETLQDKRGDGTVRVAPVLPTRRWRFAPRVGVKPAVWGPGVPDLRLRDDLAVQMHGALLENHSLAHVLRCLTLGLYHQGVQVGWQSVEREAKMPSYIGTLGALQGEPLGPHVVLAIDSVNFPASNYERGRVHIDCSDSYHTRDPKRIGYYSSPAVDFLWVYSDLCRKRWIEGGVPEEKVVVIPLGVDLLKFTPEGTKYEIAGDLRWWDRSGQETGEGRFAFMVAGYLQKRKGVPETLEAYCQAFGGRDDVVLLVKNVGDCWGLSQKNAIEDVTGRYPNHPPLAYLNRCISDWDFAALLRRVDCLVSAHHLEGFGLIPLQAMACGTQVIITNYHGPTAYATTENALLLEPTGEIEAEVCIGTDRSQERHVAVTWADYEVDDLADLMLRAKSCEERGRVRAGLETVKQFTWEATAEKFVQHLEERVGYVKRRARKWCRHGLLTVMIPVRNGATKLKRMLETLLTGKVGDKVEVLVFDDQSTDEEAEKLRDMEVRFEPVRLLRSDKHVGCYVGRCIMFEEARGEYILVADGDLDFSLTEPQWMEVAVDCLKRRRAGIVHPLLIFPPWLKGNQQIVQSAGGYIASTEDLPCHHRFVMEPISAPGVMDEVEVPYCCGAFQFFDHDLLNHISQAHNYFPSYYGDVDFCYSARAAGWPVWYCPQIVVVHDAGSWTKTAEGLQLEGEHWTENQRLFASRWRDMALADKQRQDTTGALRRAK